MFILYIYVITEYTNVCIFFKVCLLAMGKPHYYQCDNDITLKYIGELNGTESQWTWMMCSMFTE